MDQDNQNNEENYLDNEQKDEEVFKDDFEEYEEPEEKPIPTIYSEVTRETREILRRYDVGDRSERSVKVICSWLLQTEQQSLYPEKRLLSKLHPKDLEDVAQNIIYQEYAPKELIFLQTEIGTSYYIIFSGSVNIMLADLKNIDMDLHKQYTDEKFKIEHEGFPKLQNSPITEKAKILGNSINLSKILETLPQGKYFGELALMSKDPIRTATAIAPDYTELLSIHKNSFDKYIRNKHFLSEDFEAQIESLTRVDIFSDWNISRTSSIVYWSKCCHYRNSTIIHKEGDKIEGIDFIYEGMVKILINNPLTNKPIELSIYPRGTFYGEELLCLKNDIYEYSVIASSPVTILRLYERDFNRFNKLCKSTECIRKLNRICKGKKEFRDERLIEFSSTLPLLSMKPLSPLSTSINNNNNNRLPFSPVRTKQQSQQQQQHLIPVSSIQNVYKRSDRILEENIMKTCPTYNIKGSYWKIQESPFVIKSKKKKNQSSSSLPTTTTTTASALTKTKAKAKAKSSKSKTSLSSSSSCCSYSAVDIKKQIESCEIHEIPMYCKRYKKKKHPLL